MIPITITLTNKKVAPATTFQSIGLILDLGNTKLQENEIKFISPGERDSLFTTPTTTNETYRKLISFFQNSTGNGVYVLNLGIPTDDGAGNKVYTQIFTNLITFLNNNTVTPYTILVPSDFWGLSQFLQLANDYAELDSMLYFLAETQGTAFTSGTWQDYKGIKSIMGIFHSVGETGYSSGGAIHGILCSNKYSPISSVNQVTSLEYSDVIGVPYTQGDTGFQRDLVTENIVFFGRTAQEITVSNAKLADGKQYTYYFNQDYTVKKIIDNVEIFIYNGSNSQPPLKYNDKGISDFAIAVEGAISSCVSVGAVNSYTVSTIDFATYIAQFPEDYANETYNGCSCVIDGQKYILSVNLGVQYS